MDSSSSSGSNNRIILIGSSAPPADADENSNDFSDYEGFSKPELDKCDFCEEKEIDKLRLHLISEHLFKPKCPL